ncbi:unnamed protein product [Prorocentrum cordatum]|uniref:Secreted protein n=1 Tax=Prorocentrum cordatum TaxID=2364126 RepID=A0ABN9WQY7_9DINO|nr:unnamed protein product [Polarella glacialis]
MKVSMMEWFAAIQAMVALYLAVGWCPPVMRSLLLKLMPLQTKIWRRPMALRVFTQVLALAWSREPHETTTQTNPTPSSMFFLVSAFLVPRSLGLIVVASESAALTLVVAIICGAATKSTASVEWGFSPRL